MFINALSWKKFNGGKKKPLVDLQPAKAGKGMAFRAPLDNIHPTVDNNKNIQNALCHGSKATSLTDGRRGLDMARTAPPGSRVQEVTRPQASLLQGCKSYSQVRAVYFLGIQYLAASIPAEELLNL
jgi:hypothetical protein